MEEGFKIFNNMYIRIVMVGGLASKIEFTNKKINKVLSTVAFKIMDYFKGKKPDFSVIPIDLSGFSPLYVKILMQVRKIPYGAVKTYGEIASALNLKTPRLAGYALNKNPYLVIIPCHRVIAANSAGGFSAGLRIKKKAIGYRGN